MLYLDPWNKVMVMAGAAAAVAITILMVVCFVGDGCLVHDVISRKRKKKNLAKEFSSGVYGAADKSSVNLTNYTAVGTKEVVHIPSRQQSIATVMAVTEKGEHSLLSRLSSRSCRDSTYSSMSSGRTSPSSTRSANLRSSSPALSDVQSDDKISPPAISFSLLANIIPDSTTIKLAIAVESVTNLPSRDYGAHPDPWVSATVLCERRSIRRRAPANLAFFRTTTLRHAHSPVFSQTFITDILRDEMKNTSIMLRVMDQDRYCGPVELGHTSISMKEAKQNIVEPEKFEATHILKQTKRLCGELLLGLSYLPTAQRLSFSLIKVNNIKLEKFTDEESINPYIRIMMFSQSGRLIKKKKTTVKVNTSEPVFNETLNFEVAPGHLDTSRFLVTLWNRRQVLDMKIMEETKDLVHHDSSDQEGGSPVGMMGGFDKSSRRGSQGRQKDVCMGRIALGNHVEGEKQREHYRAVCQTTRQVFSMWHSLA